ncbi:MAG: class C sortase [Bacillota bacterium]|nr:class C sortase [Bacillota bacterium]
MKISIKGILGHLLIIFGILIPLIGFFGMTWNNLTAQKSYQAFKEDYSTQVDQMNFQEDLEAYNNKIKNHDQLSALDPFTVENYKGSYEIENFDQDQVFSYLIIPKLDIIRPIYLDATNDHLAMGISQIDGTSLPIGGQGTRSVLAGHRGWYNDVMFLYLDDLQAGDIFFIDNGVEQLKYQVTDKEVIGPSDWDKLSPKEDQDIVTLLTCHPFGPPRPDRLLVNGQRIIEEKENIGAENLQTETQEAQKDQESPRPSQIKVEKSPTSKKLNKIIYIITGLLSLGLIISIISFIKYLIKGKRNQ